MAKLWGGRFEKETNQAVEAFSASMSLDQRMWHADIIGSIAHVRMLGMKGIIPPQDSSEIIAGLQIVRNRIAKGELQFDPNAEDVHSEIERFLTEEIGPVAGKLHTGRSRNDQVVTDVRLYMRAEIDGLDSMLSDIMGWIVEAAPQYVETMLPGLTHTQHAQPVSLAHHLLAYFWMFERDRDRLRDGRKRMNRLPLGSAALAGTGFPLDRQMVAKELGFEGVIPNSLDAVSDRDWIIEFLSAAATIMTHLSRLCEELIWWSSPDLGFVECDDTVTTGSSIMPQKKNPDVAELIRGRVGKVVGDLTGMLVTMKSLPLAYNRDLQEDKSYLFDALDTVKSCLEMSYLMLSTAQFRPQQMMDSLSGDFSNATDLADYLARKGMPFRQAHSVVGHVVRWCIEQELHLENLSVAQLRAFSELIGEDAPQYLQHIAVMRARTSEGGTAPSAVLEQIEKAKAAL
ncbi:MAG: argininosuccinate lyase [Armatimonadota bacterium]